MPPHQWGKYISQLSKVLGHEQARLELRWMTQSLPRPQLDDSRGSQTLSAMVTRRASGEPLQYILGTQPFGVLNLLTRPPVLIPRTETEDWTMRLAQYISPSPDKPLRLLDLCTGSGCIPLLLCRLWPPGSVQAFGVDISEDAVQLALDNAKLCNVGVPSDASPALAGQNTFLPLLANIRDPTFISESGLRRPFDVITSNPPYIPKREYDALPTSVKGFEDVRALLGDPEQDPQGHGLTFYHAIADLVASENILAVGGTLAVEVGQGQARDVERILRDEGGLRSTAIWKDPWDIERVVVASKAH